MSRTSSQKVQGQEMAVRDGKKAERIQGLPLPCPLSFSLRTLSPPRQRNSPSKDIAASETFIRLLHNPVLKT